MPLVFPSRRPVPNELLHRIILRVIANSVHAICVCPSDVEWEMNVLPTLCKVSYNFRAITLELTKRTFQVTPEGDISSIFPPIAKQLQRLRLSGLRLHRPSQSSSHFEPLAEDSLLVYGYSLFLAAMNLRYNSLGSSQTFHTTQEIILSALSMSLYICPKVEPAGMADVLSEAMHKEMYLVRSGLDIVQASVTLGQLMELRASLDDSENENVDEKRLENEARILKEIEKIEVADKIYVEVIESDKIFIPAELPGVIPTIKKLRKVHFQDNENEIATRLDTLLHRWSKTFIFLGEFVESTS